LGLTNQLHQFTKKSTRFSDHSQRVNSAIAAFCEGVIEAGWLVCLITIPLSFDLFSKQVFEPDKQALFRWVVGIMTAAWSLTNVSSLGSLDPRKIYPCIKRILNTPLVGPVIVLFTSYLVSSIFSISPQDSWLGSHIRSQGTFTLVCSLIFFLLVWRNLRTAEQWRRVLYVIMFTSVPISLFGIAQYCGLDPILWGKVVEDEIGIRVSSTLGNPIFFGAYCTFPLIISLGWFLSHCLYRRASFSPHGSRFQVVVFRTALVIVVLLNLICLFLTSSRGPVLGFFIGSTVLGIGFLGSKISWDFSGISRSFLRLSLAGVSFLAALLMMGLFLSSSHTDENLRKSRFSSLVSPTVIVRLLIWDSAMDLMSSESPLMNPDEQTDELGGVRRWIGYGPETFSRTFIRHYPKNLGHYEHRRGRADRAHNMFLDSFVTRGVLGLISLLILFYSIFYSSLNGMGYLSSKKHKTTYLVLTLSLVAIGGLSSWLIVPRLFGVTIFLGLLIPFLWYWVLPDWGISSRTKSVNPPGAEHWLVITLVSAIVAHFVELQSGFNTASTQVYFWFCVAGLFVLVDHKIKSTHQKKLNSESEEDNQRSEILISALLIGIVAASYCFNFTGNWERSRSLTGSVFRNSMGTTDASTLFDLPHLFLILVLTIIFGVSLGFIPLNSSKNGGVTGNFKSIGILVFFSFGLVYLILSIQAWLYKSAVLVSRESSDRLWFVHQDRPPFLALWIGLTILLILTALVLSRRSVFQTKSVNLLVVPSIVVALYLLLGLWNHETRKIEADVLLKLANAASSVKQYELSYRYLEHIEKLNRFENHHSLALAAIELQHARQISDPEKTEKLFMRSEANLIRAEQFSPYLLDPIEGLAGLYRIWGDLKPSASKRHEKFNSALTQLKRALVLAPGIGYLHHEIAGIHFRLGQFGKASESWGEAIRLDPFFTKAYLSLGNLKTLQAELEVRKGAFDQAEVRFTEARHIFTTLLEINPEFESAKTALKGISERIEQLSKENGG